MHDLATLRHLFAYSDWGNRLVLDGASALSDEQLDRPLEIGPGSLRKILLHTYNGELMWLSRWKQEPARPWPAENVLTPVRELASSYQRVSEERERFFDGLDPAKLSVEQTYRDSKGSPFRALLGEMINQALVHSIHHRAQGVNAIRRVGGPSLELDYMMRIRQPAG